MSSITFLTDNYVDNAELSIITGVENSQFPLTNLQHDFTTKVFRSTTSNVEILVDLGQTSAVDTFAMVGSSVDGIGLSTVKIYGSPTTDFSGSTEHIVDINIANNFGFKIFTEESHRYWKVTITGATYCELSNIYIGSKTGLPNNGISTKSFSYYNKDNSKISKNKYNHKFIDTYNTIKYLSGQIKLINAEEFDTLQYIYDNHMLRKPLFFLLDPNGDMPETNSEYLYSGYFYIQKEFTYKMVAPGLYNINLQLEAGS